jgi:hypothetical protein
LKILLKTPNTKEFSNNDIFALNLTFKNPSGKIRIPVAHAKETKTNVVNDI